MKIAAQILAFAALAIVTVSCGRGDGFSETYALGERISAVALEAFEVEHAILDSLEFQPFTYQRVRNLGTASAVGQVCGVKYQLSADAWGIVPDLMFTCEDEQSEQRALQEAKTRLQSLINLPRSEYESRLQAMLGPASSMTSHGPALVYAHNLGVQFDLGSCFRTVSDRLAESATSAASLQCETFLDPGASLEAFREELRQAAGRAQSLTTVSLAHPPTVLSAVVAARCQAIPGTAGLAVPGSVAGVLYSRDVAYPIRLGPGQAVDINLTSGSFDTELSLYDQSCNTRLSNDDDGGDGTNSRIRWTSPQGGDYVLVVAFFGSGGGGQYNLETSTLSVDRPLTDQEQEDLQAFVQWVENATDEELLSTWRGSTTTDLQMACLSRECYQSRAGAHASVLGEAVSACFGALDQAVEAREAVLAGGQ